MVKLMTGPKAEGKEPKNHIEKASPTSHLYSRGFTSEGIIRRTPQKSTPRRNIFRYRQSRRNPASKQQALSSLKNQKMSF